MKDKTILLHGAYGERNLGDDLLLDVILEWLTDEGMNLSNVYITSNNKDYLSKLYPKIGFLTKLEARFFNPDLLILGGGTQYFKFANNSKGVSKYETLIFHFNLLRNKPGIYFKALSFFLSKKKTFPKIGLGLGVGPFEEKGSEVIVKKKLGDFDMVFSRDQYTYSICKDFSINTKHVADICFSSYFKNRFNYSHSKSEQEKMRVGVVLRDWPHNDTGKILNTKLLKWIKSNKGTYVFNLFTFSSLKDKELIEKLRKLPFKLNIWDPNKYSFREYLKLLSQMDSIITSRFHAGIFGANFNIPTICLGIDPKLYYLAKIISGFQYFESDDNQNDLTEYLENIDSIYTKTQKDIETSVSKLNIKADEQFIKASKYLY